MRTQQALAFKGIVLRIKHTDLETLRAEARSGTRQHQRRYYRPANILMVNPLGFQEALPDELEGMQVVQSRQMRVGFIFVVYVDDHDADITL